MNSKEHYDFFFFVSRPIFLAIIWIFFYEKVFFVSLYMPFFLRFMYLTTIITHSWYRVATFCVRCQIVVLFGYPQYTKTTPVVCSRKGRKNYKITLMKKTL